MARACRRLPHRLRLGLAVDLGLRYLGTGGLVGVEKLEIEIWIAYVTSIFSAKDDNATAVT